MRPTMARNHSKSQKKSQNYKIMNSWHRRYCPPFHSAIVHRLISATSPAAVAGEELGINANLLCAWRELVPTVAGGRAPVAKPGSVADLQSQWEAAQRQLHHVREQCTILKKTLGILSEPPSNGMNGLTRWKTSIPS